MKTTKPSVQILAAFALVCGASLTACAQIGSGWTSYTPGKHIQLIGPGTKYSNSGGIETFTMKSGDQRSEMRVEDDYSSGQRQFEGYLKANYGNGTCMKQVFKFAMVVYYPSNGGELRQHSSTKMIQNIKGVWVRINTIHNVSAKTCDVYVNGVKKATVTQGSGPWYNKYGVYNCSTEGAQSQWKNIKYWKK